MLMPAAPVFAELKVSASGWSSERSYNVSAMRTTVLQLMTTPTPFDGRTVRVVGVLSVEFEDHRLYFSKEFYDAFLPQYAIELRLPKGAEAASTQFQGKYVLVEGTFRIESGTASNGLIEVTSLEAAEEPRRSHAK
jgi:hypothetical protein